MTSDDDVFHPWWRDALCAELGSELFFLRDGEPGAEAKQACRLCPVRVNCLADAIPNDIEHGIFGGFGRDTRRLLAARVEAGEDPMVVATEAIEREKRARVRAATDPAGHRRGPSGRRGRADLVSALARRRSEERPDVAAQRPRAVGE